MKIKKYIKKYPILFAGITVLLSPLIFSKSAPKASSTSNAPFTFAIVIPAGTF